MITFSFNKITRGLEAKNASIIRYYLIKKKFTVEPAAVEYFKLLYAG